MLFYIIGNISMQKNYIAGYYLIKHSSFPYAINESKIVYTCSNCINTVAFDVWCLSWTKSQLKKKELEELGLNDEIITKIHAWTDDKFDKKEIAWGNTFPSLTLAQEFKALFYQNRKDIGVYCIEFSESELNCLLDDFDPNNNPESNYNKGEFGLRENLLKRISTKDESIWEYLGHDFIGVGCDGSFHTIYCCGAPEELIEKFDLTINNFGLFDGITNYEDIKDYLNSDETGLEPDPWYIVKVSKLKD